MINTKFEAYKLRRELKRSGKTYKIERYGVNGYGEPVKNATSKIGEFKACIMNKTDICKCQQQTQRKLYLKRYL